VNKSSDALMIFGAVIHLSGIAAGMRVETHMIIITGWFPGQVLSKRPTQSTMILLKDYSNAGIGRS